MKKIWNLVIGGIENKIFNLFLMTFIVIVGAFMGVLVWQTKLLSSIAAETSQKQVEMMSGITNETMNQVVTSNLNDLTDLTAEKFDSTFRVLRSEVEILSDYAELLLQDPSSFPAVSVSPPDASKEGKVTAQLLYEDPSKASDPAVRARTGLFGNMSGMMLSVFNQFEEIDSCFIASTDGSFIIVDDNSAGKFDDKGELIDIPVTKRPWYTGAAEAGQVYFTDVEEDIFTKRIGLNCSMPVYDRQGNLAGVVGADLFLETLSETVEESDEKGGIFFIVNQAGHIIFSPMTEGIFAVSDPDSDTSITEGDSELSEFIREALKQKAECRLITVGDELYYMAGVPMETVGWTAVTAVSKDLVDQPAAAMNEQYTGIQSEATETYRNSIARSRSTTMLIMLAVLILGIISAVILGKRIVSPLTRMTKEIGSLGGDHLQFRMKDIYKTDDEIQVLAESFADLSAKTLRYVEEVKNVTAEKERIGAEMNMATDIQASQLPSTFPPYPEREEFNIFASMTPAKEVGGDFYDFFLIDDDHLGMVMADVSGKGVPAALFMMIAKILVKNRLQSGEGPRAALENVNRQLLEGNNADMFVTVWCAVLTLSTGQGIAANAGQEHPAIRRKDGLYELVKYRHSPAIAMIDDLSFREHGFRLNPGDSLFVYTDGVPEATDRHLELFGTDRMLEALNSEADASPEKIVHNVMNHITAFVDGNQQFDDITMLALKYNGPRKDS